jgi:septum site-determining protein MinC
LAYFVKIGGQTMSVEVLVQGSESELLIDLKALTGFGELKAELERSIRTIEGYSLGSKVSIDIGGRRLTERQLRELEDILLDHGLRLKDIITTPVSANAATHELPEFSRWDEGLADYGETALICRNLRSGQKFFTRGNVVILGDINPGAEVIAGGNILVMGVLRGMAHAGAFGDENSIVAAYRLNPTQLRIADHITRPPDGETVVINNPELARIRAGKVIIEKLKI